MISDNMSLAFEMTFAQISFHTFAQLKSSSSLSEKKKTFNTTMNRVLIVQVQTNIRNANEF